MKKRMKMRPISDKSTKSVGLQITGILDIYIPRLPDTTISRLKETVLKL